MLQQFGNGTRTSLRPESQVDISEHTKCPKGSGPFMPPQLQQADGIRLKGPPQDRFRRVC